MAYKFEIPVRDRNGKYSSSFRGWQLPAADAVTALALQSAVAGLIKGVPGAVNQIEFTELVAAIAGPAPADAVRGIKYYVVYQDAVDGSTHSSELPTADYSLLIPGSEAIDITAGAGLAMKDAFEAHVASPPQSGGIGGGNAVVVTNILATLRDLL